MFYSGPVRQKVLKFDNHARIYTDNHNHHYETNKEESDVLQTMNRYDDIAFLLAIETVLLQGNIRS